MFTNDAALPASPKGEPGQSRQNPEVSDSPNNFPVSGVGGHEKAISLPVGTGRLIPVILANRHPLPKVAGM